MTYFLASGDRSKSVDKYLPEVSEENDLINHSISVPSVHGVGDFGSGCSLSKEAMESKTFRMEMSSVVAEALVPTLASLVTFFWLDVVVV